MTRIAFVYPHTTIQAPVPTLYDALAICMYEMTRRLARRHEVVAYPRRGPGDPAESVQEGVTFHRIPVRSDELMGVLKLADRLGLTRKDRPYRFTLAYYLHYAVAVARDMRRRRIELAHIFGNPNFIPIIRHFNPGIRICLHSHDHALADFDRELTLKRLRHADLILGCSRFITDNIAKRFPEVAERCHHLHNGVDERFLGVASRPEESRNVLFIGRVTPEKGVHVLVEAFGRVAERHDAHLAIVGPNDLAPKHFVDPFGQDPLLAGVEHYYGRAGAYLRDLQAAAAGSGRTSFVGRIANSEIVDRLATAGVFCFVSLWHEPFGIPMIEAMAAGLPVIATNAGAAPEIVENGVTGLLVERGDAAGLSAALDRLLGAPAERRRMGEAGRERVRRHFLWDHSVARLEQLYAAVVSRPTGQVTPVPPRPQ
ncbi:MAG TPA: glycosyltransferase family 4 protein [Geminicoccaceae bacterium]|nr:glycosyltransferase family 4 protein [Geminicoccus sp.]HMU50576.1 glycosyltransferase family 4 protein [Geminicoccaceae bacterium]